VSYSPSKFANLTKQWLAQRSPASSGYTFCATIFGKSGFLTFQAELQKKSPHNPPVFFKLCWVLRGLTENDFKFGKDCLPTKKMAIKKWQQKKISFFAINFSPLKKKKSNFILFFLLSNSLKFQIKKEKKSSLFVFTL
jgi:hypothetical protein